MAFTKTLKIRVTPEQLERWKKAAKAQELSLSVWIRTTLNKHLRGASHGHSLQGISVLLEGKKT